jgi:tetratricopeptide (TPR) repeat protein
MDLAHLVPLANEDNRYLLAEALQKRGLKEAARRERELFLRLGEFTSWYIDEAVRLEANDALVRKDYLKAADGYERFILSCLRPSTGMVEIESYLLVPRFIHHHRARGHLAAGRLDEAVREARLALEAMPGSLDVAIDLAPELDRRGRKQDADELFQSVFEVEEEICRDFPKSAHHHNAAAWLGATCRRELDRSSAHAEEAVRLAPENPSYLDTLAELHFQRGAADKAIALMKKCLEIAPKRRYYQEQMKRFEAGDPKVPVPDENAPD